MSRDLTSQFEIVVVGGGPAGSSAAGFAARAGKRVLLVERERFPRFHIGESLLPESNEILQAMGVEDRIRQAGFVVKRGASFWTEDGSAQRYVDFSQSREVRAPLTYQVPRDRFDEILLEHARESGAEVRQGCRAEAVELGAAGATVVLTGDGRRRRVRARVLIDASGQAGFLAKRLRLRRPDPQLRCVAAHSHYAGVPQLEGDRAGDIRIVSLRDMSWVWLIPLSETVTSVGVVVPWAHRERRDRAPGGILEGTLRSIPSLAPLFESAERLVPVRRDADFSYSPSRYAGDGWLLAGDAGSFLDPVFSTGVLLALKSGREAAGAAVRGLDRGDLSARGLAPYDRTQRSTYRHFRRMVAAFYDPAFRDVLFRPSNRLGLLEAVITTLAGVSKPRPVTRLRLSLFFLVVGLHRRFGLGERIHRLPELEKASA